MVSGEQPHPPSDALLNIINGLTKVDEESWEELTVEATGGPCLNPDKGNGGDLTARYPAISRCLAS